MGVNAPEFAAHDSLGRCRPNGERQVNRPLLGPLAGLICGLLSAAIHGIFLPPWTLFALLAAMLAAAVWGRGLPFAVLAAAFFFCWGGHALKPRLRPDFPPGHIVHHVAETACIVEGTIAERPVATGSGGRFVLSVERVVRDGLSTPAIGRLLVSVGEGRCAFLTGDRVRFEARLRRPRNFGLPGEPDRERALAFRDIYAVGFVPRADALFLTAQAVENPVGRFMDKTAREIASRIEMSVPGDAGAVMGALLIGERGKVARETEELFARTGVNHILSISGFHVSVVASAIFFLLLTAARGSAFLMLRFNLRRFLLLLALPVLFLYLVLSGGAPATTRSVIMIAVYILALFLERESDPVHSLMLAAFLILLAQPTDLFDISFQLSFLALWGILVLVPILMGPFANLPEKAPIRLAVQFMMVSLAATLATLVPVAATFHRTTLTGLLANFVVVPLMGYGAVLLGFAALPLMPVSPTIAGLLLKGAGITVSLSCQALRLLDHIPPLPSWSPRPLHYLLLFLLLAVLTFVRAKRPRRILAWSSLLLLVPVSIPPLSPEKPLQVTFFSLGQCESTLVTFPNGKRMLVDGGGSFATAGPDVGERLLAPALRTLGVERIDYMVLTHPHPDHMKGLLYIAAHFPVGEFWEAGWGEGADYLELKRLLAAGHATVRHLDAETGALRIGDARIDPLAPRRGSRKEDLNEDSLVFRLAYGDFSMLFTGDIGAEVEQSLVDGKGELACTVLKVPHHGSGGSSTARFLQKTRPCLAIISAGYGNSFHLPHPDALRRLSGAGARVLRTDLDGTLAISSDGITWSVSTWQGPFGQFI